jgi:nicotinamidase/pyrazinamidase
VVKLGAKSTIASLDVDAQYSFTEACPDELPVLQGEEIVAELNQQARFAQYRLGSKEAHPAHPAWEASAQHLAYSPLVGVKNADTYWPAHCLPGTKGFKLIKGLPHPQDYDFFVWKGVEPDMHPYGSCYHDLEEKLSTGLLDFLKNKEIKTVIVGGLATDYCVKVTVLQLLKAGFRIIVNLGACRGLQPKTTEEAIVEMKKKGAIMIHSCLELEP